MMRNIKPTITTTLLLIAYTLWIPQTCFALDPPKPISELTPLERKTFEESQELWIRKINQPGLEFERVTSSDSFLASGVPIKLWGIKGLPEDHNAYRAATLLLETLLKGGDLTCQPLDDELSDKANMSCSADGIDISAMMVRMGMARDYPEESQGFYDQDEQEAKEQQRGMWSSELADTRVFLDDMEKKE